MPFSKKILSDENLQLITGQIFVGKAILIGYKLGLFKILNKGPSSLSQISNFISIKERGAQTLISCAAALKFIKFKKEKYHLTALGKSYFDENSPSYYGPVLDLLIEQENLMSLEALERSILTDNPQADNETGVFTEKAIISNSIKFVTALHQKAYNPSKKWVNLLSLENYKLLIDIGGGSGIHSISACKTNPKLQAIVCDRAPVVPHTKEFIKQNGLSNRIQTCSFDLWKDPFPKGDIMFLGDVFHDWERESCLTIAKKCYTALNDEGIIILHEMIFNEGKEGPFLTAAYNTKMSVWTKGNQYTFNEIKEILEEAGFAKVNIKKSLGNWSLIIGNKE